jgi:hypothetical protein
MADLIPKTDEHAAVREQFHKWCWDQQIDDTLWMPNQPWCGYANARVNDYWLGFLAAHDYGVGEVGHGND